MTSTISAALKFLSKVQETLVHKNAQYGDSASNPVRIFSKADVDEQLLVRIDDKLSRIARGDAALEDEDVLLDLVGYLALLAGTRNSSG